MGVRNKQSIYLVTALFLVGVFVLGVLHGCKRQKPEATGPGTATPAAATENGSSSTANAAASLFGQPKASIQNIVNGAKDRWSPKFEGWWGKLAPDFALMDLDGQSHKLSDYRGKEVVVVFWASWCGPCKMEIPHLKELRNALPADKLAILAVDMKEPPAVVKDFVAAQGINYTVLLSSDTLPAPYNEVVNIPSSFFVGADGRFKAATQGMIPATDAKALVQAQ
jgi:thiol-disulfide isomerase/thioredoxin